MKLPRYTWHERRIFQKMKQLFPELKPNTPPSKEIITYVFVCPHCSKMNQHLVKYAEIGGILKYLKCQYCQQPYQLRPSPLMFDDGKKDQTSI